MPNDANFTLRYSKKLERRIFDVIAASENEATRTGLFIQAMEMFLAQLEVYPGLVPNYDPKRDRSARQNVKTRCKERECDEEGD